MYNLRKKNFGPFIKTNLSSSSILPNNDKLPIKAGNETMEVENFSSISKLSSAVHSTNREDQIPQGKVRKTGPKTIRSSYNDDIIIEGHSHDLRNKKIKLEKLAQSKNIFKSSPIISNNIELGIKDRLRRKVVTINSKQAMSQDVSSIPKLSNVVRPVKSKVKITRNEACSKTVEQDINDRLHQKIYKTIEVIDALPILTFSSVCPSKIRTNENEVEESLNTIRNNLGSDDVRGSSVVHKSINKQINHTNLSDNVELGIRDTLDYESSADEASTRVSSVSKLSSAVCSNKSDVEIIPNKIKAENNTNKTNAIRTLDVSQTKSHIEPISNLNNNKRKIIENLVVSLNESKAAVLTIDDRTRQGNDKDVKNVSCKKRKRNVDIDIKTRQLTVPVTNLGQNENDSNHSVEVGSNGLSSAYENLEFVLVGQTNNVNTINRIHENLIVHQELGELVDPLSLSVWEQENNDLLPVENEVLLDKRKRNKKPDKSKWAREITKNNREHGVAYQGYESKRGDKRKISKPRPERKIGPRCGSAICSLKRHCNELGEQQRLETFNEFWMDMSWDQKKIYVAGLVDMDSVNMTNVTNFRRSFSPKYFLRINGTRKQVCKSFFMSSLGLNEWMIKNWVVSSTNGIIPAKAILNARRAAVRPLCKLYQENNIKKEFLLKFLDDLPKMPSHYCRLRTNKIYIEPNFQSLSELYQFYCIKCTNNNNIPLSSCYFSNMFNEKNFSIYQPRKDRCDVCMGFEKKNIDLGTYNLHIVQKKRAQTEKKLDKIKARAGLAHVFAMDAEAVQLAPKNNASLLYYKTRLKVHDFSMYNLASKACSCYWWHEGEGDMCASIFTTCILKHLDNYCNDNLPIILWSDGCVYQNRNQILSNALLDYAIRTGKIVQQKYLVKGHTQMEVDNVHSLIERKVKARTIDLPSDYLTITREARSRLPLEAVLMSHKDFKKFDDSRLHWYNSIRPGNYVHDATVTDISVLTYCPEGKITYKINFDDNAQELPRQRKTPQIDYLDIENLYTGPIKIPAKKFKHLQEFKLVLPEEAHNFYDNLIHEK